MIKAGPLLEEVGKLSLDLSQVSFETPEKQESKKRKRIDEDILTDALVLKPSHFELII